MPSENPVSTAKETAPQKVQAISMGARGLVLREVLRGLGAACWLPVRACGQFLTNASLKAAVQKDLASAPPFAPDTRALDLPDRPLRIFISCAEASGETHAVNWVRALRKILRDCGAPEPELCGLGGARLAGEGVRILGDPVSDARMGFAGILGALPFYLGLVARSAQTFLGGRLDLFVAVDSPALHVPLGHMARRAGVRSVLYITPQYWGWAPWRVQGFKRAFDLALSILPFEPAWFERHGVPVEHVGHPQLDVFGPVSTTASSEALVAVLPGSRRSVIARNLPLMLASLKEHIGTDDPWRIVVLQSTDAHRELIENCLQQSGLDPNLTELSLDLEAGLNRAQAALSVSGTILTHLLHHRLPAVVIYRLENSLQQWMGQHFLTVPYFSSVNLLAGEEVYPEFSFAAQTAPAEYGACVKRLLHDAPWRADCSRRLAAAAERLGPPGANHRAALAALARLGPGQPPTTFP